MAAREVKHSLSSEKKHFELTGKGEHCAEQQDVCDIKHKADRLVQIFFVAVSMNNPVGPGTKLHNLGLCYRR